MTSPHTPPANWLKGFWFLMATQFQNALSDNALKQLVILVAISTDTSSDPNSHVALAGLLFSAPFIIFSMLGGWLADRFSKQQVMQGVKYAEIFIMLLATVGLATHHRLIQFTSVFLMGCHSAIFGPSKYAVLPELLPAEKLSWGNGILELLTFLGIIGGSILAGLGTDYFEAAKIWHSGIILTLIAIVGALLCRKVPVVPAANPQAPLRINPFTDISSCISSIRHDTDLIRALWGNTGFYFIAALVQMNIVVFAKSTLELTDAKTGPLLAALAIGIGIGSVIAGQLSKGKIEYRLIPLGSIIMTLSSMPMGMNGIQIMPFSFALVALGIGAGLFIVPIASVLQYRPSAETKGAVQGAASVISFGGIALASGIQGLLSLDAVTKVVKISAAHMFWFCGALAFASGLYVYWSRRNLFWKSQNEL